MRRGGGRGDAKQKGEFSRIYRARGTESSFQINTLAKNTLHETRHGWCPFLYYPCWRQTMEIKNLALYYVLIEGICNATSNVC